MSKQQAPVAKNQLNKNDKNTVDAYHTACQCYFRPETSDLIFLSKADSGSFDDLTIKLSRLMDQLDEARHGFSAALEEYYDKRNDIASQEKLPTYYNKVISAEEVVEKATKALQDEVGSFDEQVGYAHIIELIPLEPFRRGIFGRFYCYLKKDDYDNFKSKLTLFNLKDFGADDIYQKDGDGRIISIDRKKIQEKINKIKESLAGMASGDKTFSIKSEYEKNLTDWADAWNSQAEYALEGQFIDVSAGAQFLRFSSNAGAVVDWNPKGRKGRISGEASAKFVLAAGQASTTFYLPDRGGWQLKFIINDQNKEANLGVLRAQIDATLTCFAGASANLEGNLQFVTSGGEQRLMGLRGPFSHLTDRQDGVRVDTEKEPAVSSEASIEMFAGAKAGGTYRGALQWLKPFDSLVDSLPDMLRTFGLESVLPDTQILQKVVESRSQLEGKEAEKGKFTDFAVFTAGTEGQLGGGSSGDFQFKFEDGKFKFHISAGLCLGPGAKGTAQGEVSPAQFTEFAIWTVYQLYGIDFKHLGLIANNAFKALTYILLMGGEKIYNKYYNLMRADIDLVFRDFERFIEKMQGEISNAIDTSSFRNNFAAKINDFSLNVYSLTPEGKGISLYILVQNGNYDYIDINNIKMVSLINNEESFILSVPDVGHNRKKAILAILSSIQTKREWAEVMVRMSSTGDKIVKNLSIPEESLLIKSQQDIIRKALTIGLDQDKKLDELISKLDLKDFEAVYKRLKDKPAFGYPFAPNCSKQYFLFCNDNPWYNSWCYIVPQDPSIKHKLESI